MRCQTTAAAAAAACDQWPLPLYNVAVVVAFAPAVISPLTTFLLRSGLNLLLAWKRRRGEKTASSFLSAFSPDRKNSPSQERSRKKGGWPLPRQGKGNRNAEEGKRMKMKSSSSSSSDTVIPK